MAFSCAEDIKLIFLWFDEDNLSTIHLLGLVRNPGKRNTFDDKSVRYYANDDCPAASSKVDYNGKDNKKRSYQWRKNNFRIISKFAL